MPPQIRELLPKEMKLIKSERQCIECGKASESNYCSAQCAQANKKYKCKCGSTSIQAKKRRGFHGEAFEDMVCKDCGMVIVMQLPSVTDVWCQLSGENVEDANHEPAWKKRRSK